MDNKITQLLALFGIDSIPLDKLDQFNNIVGQKDDIFIFVEPYEVTVSNWDYKYDNGRMLNKIPLIRLYRYFNFPNKGLASAKEDIEKGNLSFPSKVHWLLFAILAQLNDLWLRRDIDVRNIYQY